MDDLTLLQSVRLKGRVGLGDLAATLGEDESAVGSALWKLGKAGLLAVAKTVRLSPEGRTRLTELLAAERRDIDAEAFARIYGDFRAVNREFKTLVTDWQLRNDEPNDHSDSAYDTAVIRRLDGVHRTVLPIVAAAAGQLPRLAAYARKLSAALERVHAGETTWLTRPIVDSYHTVWFELHEELIGAAGLTREGEAGAGLDE